MTPAPITGLIPAGGLSRRLGVDKTQLTLGRGKPLLAQVGRIVGSLCDELIVVGNRVRPDVLPEAIWLADAYPGMGSLGGLATGLARASHPHCLVVAGDMPFLSVRLLRRMLEEPRDYDVLIPCFDSFVEPLHAIYGRNCLDPILRLIARKERRILDFFPEVNLRCLEEPDIRAIDPELRSFFNVNTVEQLAEAWVMDLLAQRGGA